MPRLRGRNFAVQMWQGVLGRARQCDVAIGHASALEAYRSCSSGSRFEDEAPEGRDDV